MTDTEMSTWVSEHLQLRMNLCNLKKTFADYKTKGWDRIFVLVDAHGTITPSGQHAEFTFINETAKEVLQWFSKRTECRLILWTSSYPSEVEKMVQWLLSHDIRIWYVNENPEARDTERACFDKKPYYNIVIDDRASFEPEYGWLLVARELEIATGENVLYWSHERRNQLRDCIQCLKNDLNNLVILDDVINSP